ncbi:Ig-like domain-containing protein [Mariniflexile fucanivorans]|uniref:Ig-like domain-containing protein n=1 Tax=Mariniflexile fucanivorans TaxID=264023 RepID=A0A4R1RS57_9FLAO|nr:Ig-like domain-containing domain [Mariniflexile fucanivorans]TCL68802.1 Ig-like domain-containing protein [Mariniflexile fucanivorans]
MNKTLSSFILLIFLGLVFVNCANRGTPEGGPKDITPPKIVDELPKNYSTNFDGKVIKIYFDEYIKIKDISKQLIISPPMTTQPEITPLGGASKYITIKIFDTLQPNTTYAFNFGNSITDNNEGNPYPYYRYVFSTGSYIDSLSVKGNIVDALKTQPETFVNVALYEVDSTFTDSIIYKKTPKYITNTLDSVTTFSIDNIKAGKYMLMALKDGNGDNKFQQKTDEIAFYKSFITVPTDTTYTLKLFKEDLDFKANRPQIAATQKIGIGYEGDYHNMKVNVKSEIPEDFNTRITKDAKTDTLYYWYKPKLEADSLLLNISHPNFDKDFTVKIRKQKKDSLTIAGNPSGTIGIEQPFKISGSIPFTRFDASKVNLIDKDSSKVDFTTEFDSINNTYLFNFKKTEENKYNMMVLPEAFTDFFDNKNDTLKYSLSTRKASDFGFARFTLVNANYPLIIQLTTEKGEVKAERYTSKPETVDFMNLQPATYFIRVIHDANGNGKYDTGSYLNKTQPEKVSHFKEIEVRADWGYPETLEFTSD